MRGKMLINDLEPGISFLKVKVDSLAFLGLEARGVKNNVQVNTDQVD